MTLAAAAPTLAPAPVPNAGASARSPDRVGGAKRGPNTPEGKARSAGNALRHGLRARTFGLLPGEEQAEWAEHLQDLRAGYGPVDAAEEKLVAAIAAAMWNEIRADRTLAEVMAAIPPLAPGRPHGGDLQEPGHALSLNTALRYLTAASMASQRAQRAFLAHRKAKQAGLILPERPQADPANENRTNDLPTGPVPAPPNPATLEAAVAPGGRMHERIPAAAAAMAASPTDGPALDRYRLSIQTSTVPGLGFG